MSRSKKETKKEELKREKKNEPKKRSPRVVKACQATKMGFENVWFSRKNPKDKPNGQSKAISGKGTRECRFVSCASIWIST